MAANRKSKVIISSTTGDTLADGLNTSGVKVACGAVAGTVTLSVGGVTIYEANIGASSDKFEHLQLQISSGETVTVTLTGNARIYFYLR